MVPPVEALKSIGPIYDVETYLSLGRHSLGNLKKFAHLLPHHSIVDIGSGYGRVAIQLTEILSSEAKYLGIDVVKKQIDWCSSNISCHFPNFVFEHVNVQNMMYNPSGTSPAKDLHLQVVQYPEAFDLAILFSVFTHMLPDDVKSYLRSIHALLKPGGILYASFFVITPDSLAFMQEGKAQFNFKEQSCGYFVHNTGLHEAAIAYCEEDIWQMMFEAGFARDKVLFGSWAGRTRAESGQDIVVCSKR
jgi:SAM-dependent methyltransferase